jgi:hypothetical protein
MGRRKKIVAGPEPLREYTGTFSIETCGKFSREVIPSGATIVGNVVTVLNGKLTHVPGAFQIYDNHDKGFTLGYTYIKAIYRGSGEPLWVNEKYRS